MSAFVVDKNWEEFVKALQARLEWWRDESKGQFVPHPKDEDDPIDKIQADKPATIRAILDRKKVAAEWASSTPKWHQMYATLQLEYNLMGRAARDLMSRYRSPAFAQIHQASRHDHGASKYGQLQVHLIRQLTEMAPKDNP